jgi:hypothetical protein
MPEAETVGTVARLIARAAEAEALLIFAFDQLHEAIERNFAGLRG